MVLKPAVRSVTDWKKAACSFWKKFIGPSVAGFDHSTSSTMSVPPRSRMAVKTMTSLLCRRSFLKLPPFCLTSCNTAKPRPPMMISEQMVRLTTGSYWKGMRLR